MSKRERNARELPEGLQRILDKVGKPECAFCGCRDGERKLYAEGENGFLFTNALVTKTPIQSCTCPVLQRGCTACWLESCPLHKINEKEYFLSCISCGKDNHVQFDRPPGAIEAKMAACEEFGGTGVIRVNVQEGKEKQTLRIRECGTCFPIQTAKAVSAILGIDEDELKNSSVLTPAGYEKAMWQLQAMKPRGELQRRAVSLVGKLNLLRLMKKNVPTERQIEEYEKIAEDTDGSHTENYFGEAKVCQKNKQDIQQELQSTLYDEC